MTDSGEHGPPGSEMLLDERHREAYERLPTVFERAEPPAKSKGAATTTLLGGSLGPLHGPVDDPCYNPDLIWYS